MAQHASQACHFPASVIKPFITCRLCNGCLRDAVSQEHCDEWHSLCRTCMDERRHGTFPTECRVCSEPLRRKEFQKNPQLQELIWKLLPYTLRHEEEKRNVKSNSNTENEEMMPDWSDTESEPWRVDYTPPIIRVLLTYLWEKTDDVLKSNRLWKPVRQYDVEARKKAFAAECNPTVTVKEMKKHLTEFYQVDSCCRVIAVDGTEALEDELQMVDLWRLRNHQATVSKVAETMMGFIILPYHAALDDPVELTKVLRWLFSRRPRRTHLAYKTISSPKKRRLTEAPSALPARSGTV